jgi:hypothetical protein
LPNHCCLPILSFHSETSYTSQPVPGLFKLTPLRQVDTVCCRYIAHDAAGNKIEDSIEAASRNEAAQRIRQLGYFPEKISGKRRTPKNGASRAHGSPKSKAGVPSSSATVADDGRVTASHAALCGMCKRIPRNVIDSTAQVTLCQSYTVTSKGTKTVHATIQIPICSKCRRLSRLPGRSYNFLQWLQTRL